MGHKVPGDGVKLSYRILRQRHNRSVPSEEKNEGSDNAGVENAEKKWCTMECEHATWPRKNVDGSGSCRTFSALWCEVLKQHVTKNTPCAVEHGQRRPKPCW